ncbi:MAG: ankyrin repeat domain-containing protein [Burkholderiales bacterium]|nr:ankyrin repeat domain-containing protein [Burkholderiales bacterium]
MPGRSLSAGLAAAALLAALSAGARAQTDPPPASGPSGPARLIQGIGEALRGALRAILGTGEGEMVAPAEGPAPTQTAPQAAPPSPAAREPAAVTPAAQAAPQSLHSAIAKGDTATALKLIESGADVEAKDPSTGASPLHYAVMKDNIALVGLLIARGADVNSRTRSGTTPLHTAVLYGRLEIAEFLLDKGADINAKSASGATPLALADAANFQRIARMLRSRGAQ